MIHNSINCKKWEKDFLKKFQSFMKKCPVVFSIVNTPGGIYITHVGSNKKYFFEYDYEVDVKDFIHSIKVFFIPKHYPKISEIITEEVPITAYEKALLLEKNENMSKAPEFTKKIVAAKIWRIDRVMLWKNTFILVPENTFDENGNLIKNTDSPRIYKMNGSAVMYLRNYRNGKWKDLEEAGKHFFENSIYIKDLEVVE